MFEILKKKAKKIIGKDPVVIGGYLLPFVAQAQILKQHLTLYAMGFGVPHDFEPLGESILDSWIIAVKATNDSLSAVDDDTIRSQCIEYFRQEPDEEVIKKNLKLNLKKYLVHHPISFIDLFAGIGGFHLAMHSVGGACVFASEWDKYARISYEANYLPIAPQLFERDEEGNYLYFNEDINDANPHQIPHFDVLCGGFPCQPFSVAGLKRGFDDTRGTLFFNIANLVREKIRAGYPPRVLFLENVRGLKNHDKGKTLSVILATLDELGYNYSYEVLNAKYFGVPQNRERLFIIAWYRDLIEHDEFMFPYGIAPDGKTIYEKSELKEGTLPTRVSDIFEPADTIDPNFTISDRMWEGHKARKERNRMNGKGFGYSLFNGDSVYTSTISARYWKDGSEILIDQSDLGLNPRTLTPVEAGRLQGYRIIGNGWEHPECANNQNYNAFNPEFRIVVSKKEAYRKFGNSVAIPVIKRLANEIVEQLLK